MDTTSPAPLAASGSEALVIWQSSKPATPERYQLDDAEQPHLPVDTTFRPFPRQPTPSSTTKQIVAARSFRQSTFQAQHSSRPLRRPVPTGPLVQTEVSTKRASDYGD